MKNIILLIAVLIVSACATTPTVKSLAGTYQAEKDRDVGRLVLLENGIAEFYDDGNKEEGEGMWKVVDGEIHATDADGFTFISRINSDGSITLIAGKFKDGERNEARKEGQHTLKKIK